MTQSGQVAGEGVDRPDPAGTAGGRGAAEVMLGTRDRILVCALRSFAKRGFAATNVVDIEKAAGLSPGSGGFYRHFRNKEDVLRASVTGEIERVRLLHQTRREAVLAPGARAALGDRFARHLTELAQLHDLMLVLAHDAGQISDLIPTILEVMAERGLGLDTDDLAHYMAAGEITAHDPHVVATIVLAATLGYSLSQVFFGARLGGVGEADFAGVLADLVVGPPPGCPTAGQSAGR